ncbi:small GTP-binding protein [Histomonas meleagridis]|uniref:small GTP-binding protein n=1 Tax=Histomonas meleagridis TaxID=135588 RepID=UPI003559BCEC|nr:small GTP-binding protein [Histomonas meleagridis]KAH0802822.1 small GTP-binding protein [Histomonas meleagridis]
MVKISEAKIVFIGMSGVGKTSIIARISSGTFNPNHDPTIGASYTSKVIEKEQGIITLRIWDTAGQERFRSLAPMYYQGSQACLIVFALNSRESFNEAQAWYEEVKKSVDDQYLFYLLGNKSDLPERTISIEEAVAKADSMSALYFEVSARNGQNIKEVIEDIASKLLARDTSTDNNDCTPVLQDENGRDKKCGC